MDRGLQYVTYFGLATISALLWTVLSLTGFLAGLEQEALRWRYLLRGEQASAAPLVFVNVDAQTVAKMGDKPWDRLNFAQTLEALLGPGKARAVGVDIIFSPMGTGSLLDVDRARKGDYRLGEVVSRYSNKLVLAAAYTGTNLDLSSLPLRRYGYLDPSEVPFPEAPTFPIIKSLKVRLGLANIDETINQGTVPYKVPAIIDSAGEGFGHHLIRGQLRYFSGILSEPKVLAEPNFFKIVDADGFPLDFKPPRNSSHRFFTLGLAVFLAAHELGPEDVEWRSDSLVIRKQEAGFREVPLIQGQSMEVNWLQGWNGRAPQTHYSMADVQAAAHALGEAASRGDKAAVAQWEQWFERFQGKVVFIGGVDATLKDLAPTPFNRAPVPKVGLHANIYRTLADQAYMKHVVGWPVYLIVFLLTALVAALLLWSGRGKGLTRTAAGGLLLGYTAVVFYSFSLAGLVLPLIAPIGASITASLLVVLFKLGAEEGQRRRIKNLFGAYVSPRLVEDMIVSQRDPELGGTEVAITALFSDVQGFSAISEKLSPSDLVALMNEYLSAMTEAFQENQGTLDKYIGDAIVTMFGMPYPVEDHAACACRSALNMQSRHAALRKKWAEEGKWPKEVLKMRTRIGINTGSAVIGNMGSQMRFNYTMMGDSVNLASRCESGAKTYGVYIMITAETLNAALSFGDSLNYRKLDRIVVQGRSRPVEIYELWDDSVATGEAKICRELYGLALEAYFDGHWQPALAGFESCLAHEPARSYALTTPSAVLAARCREFLQHGAPESWDGVCRMGEK